MTDQDKSIAVFISQHGYGHAARACALIEAIYSLSPQTEFHLFTSVPEWFFKQSLRCNYFYHLNRVDVGIIQKTVFEEDLPATIRLLSDDIPYSTKYVSPIVEQIKAARCCAVICDISPVGIAVAEMAGIPSFLIENFTWDWIYSGYANNFPAINQFIPYLSDLFQRATFLIQSEPICMNRPAHLTIPPIGRIPRLKPSTTRNLLSVPLHHRLIFLSLGGNHTHPEDFSYMSSRPDLTFLVISTDPPILPPSNLIHLPPVSEYYHPDLIAAADVVIAKAGYSTLAEAYQSGTPFGFTLREKLSESAVLQRYILQNSLGLEINRNELGTPSWLNTLDQLLSMPKEPRASHHALDAARFILSNIK